MVVRCRHCGVLVCRNDVFRYFESRGVSLEAIVGGSVAAVELEEEHLSMMLSKQHALALAPTGSSEARETRSLSFLEADR